MLKNVISLSFMYIIVFYIYHWVNGRVASINRCHLEGSVYHIFKKKGSTKQEEEITWKDKPVLNIRTRTNSKY